MTEVPKTVPIERKETPFEIIEDGDAPDSLSGGMGTIHRARDRVSGRILAVKVLKDKASGDVTRFALEADILAKLRHPSIIEHAYHGVTKEGFPYLAMEWIEGESLEAKLRKTTTSKLPLEEALRIGFTISDALIAAHAAGITHRDIKPSNVLIKKADGSIKLADFGIAKSADSAVDLTATGEALGTPGYLAPEQARGGKVDGRTDLFSLGCLLFRCITGRRPFSGSDLMEYATNLALHDAPRIRELEPKTPASVEALIARLLMKDPAARPANAKHVRDAIDRILSEADATAPAPTADGIAESLLEPIPPTKLAEGSDPKLLLKPEDPATIHSPAVAKKKKPLAPEEAVEHHDDTTAKKKTPKRPELPLGLIVPLAIVALTLASYAAYSFIHRDKPITSSTPFVAGETWFGSYECDDGKHKLALRIVSITSDNEVAAVFDFTTPKDSSGSYNVLGTYVPETHHLTLKAGTWISQPNLVVSVGLDGTITDDDRAYSGKAVNPKCTTFTVRR
jgi:serine/threonine protein kinase